MAQRHGQARRRRRWRSLLDLNGLAGHFHIAASSQLIVAGIEEGVGMLNWLDDLGVSMQIIHRFIEDGLIAALEVVEIFKVVIHGGGV